jgi:glycerophosphoryl diester phosphodiesterase
MSNYKKYKDGFVNYAHRGASEYLPENTLLSFYTGIYMGANGIETDIRRAKDGILVLFHDSSLERVTGDTRIIEECTLSELKALDVKKAGYTDKIVTFEDFLAKFAFRDIVFAIELKGSGVEKDTADLLRKYGMVKKAVVTSFHLDYLKSFHAYAPEFEFGLLTKEVTPELEAELLALGATEICPCATLMTANDVERWHNMGFRVRAWGVKNEDVMKYAYDAGVDGMTVNFPDKLEEYRK